MSAAKVIGTGVIILALYLIINNTIGFNYIPEVNQSMGLWNTVCCWSSNFTALYSNVRWV